MADFELDDVVPWGRSLEEYVRMFSLTDADLNKKILGCGDGPASFNYELSKIGGSVVSVDPIYQFSRKQIRQRIDETSSQIIEQLHANKKRFTWTQFESPDDVVNQRRKAKDIFLDDFDEGVNQGRYVNAALPELPFANQSFDITLCSHFLFLYSDHFSLDSHIQAIKQMSRVANDVRVFPLLDSQGNI
ncbi:MAG: class I SAM-dependent methyltransferase, partial [Gammaproteobacteria bacterium]|nr:class I SAM-dependent methyltransferase [Gammaproteobacteria bacterium]